MTERIPGSLGECPCTDKTSCPECNGSLPVGDRLRARLARMTDVEAEEMLARIRDVVKDVDEDEEVHDLGGSGS